MKVFTVHTPPDVAGDEAAERAAFVKDGFSWPALFVAVLWLLWHRLWVVLLLYILAAAAIAALSVPFGDTASGIVGIVFAVWFAFEANNFRRWSLDRREWTEIGASHGRDRGEAEVRFFAARSPTRPPAAAQTRPSGPPPQEVAPWKRDPDRGPVLGLFPEHDR